MLRAFAICAAAAAVFGLSTAHAQGGALAEAGDNFVAGVQSVEFGGVIARKSDRRAPGGPILLQNPGNATTLVLGCEGACRNPRVRLRVAGMPELVASGPRGLSSRTVVLNIPRAYARSLSNFEVQLELNCDDFDRCAHEWALLSNGPAVSAGLRGLPQAITEAQWNAATDLSPQWRQRPGADDLRFYYPVAAWAQSRSGSARLQCLVATGGRLSCRVAQEDPTRQGFGESALRLATLLRVSETDQAGQPTLGRRLSVPIVFQPAGS